MIKVSKYIKYPSILILVIILIVAFYSSYDSSKIDNLAFIIAIGIDKAAENR